MPSKRTFDWTPRSAEAAGRATADDLVRLACMNYDDWHPRHAVAARELLEAKPELARADVWSAASVGDVEAVREFLVRDPALANRKGGPLDWEPLLHACYSRLDGAGAGRSTLEVARLLLARGADPNAGFLWRANVPPFTALTGAFGGGEAGRNHPPHREWRALVRALLEAGADANDGQTLYDRHFTPDDEHLVILLEFGLGRGDGGPWFARCGDRMGTPAGLLIEELWAAATLNYLDRVKLLVQQGVDVNAPGRRDGRSAWETAIRAGNREIADYLVAHGARETELDALERFAAACVRGDRDEARALLAKRSELIDALGWHRRAELVHRAVESRRPDGIRLMAELGFDLSALTRNTAMHDAAWSGDLEMVKLLVELGADPHVRDVAYDAIPLGWANYNHQANVVAWLMTLTTIHEAVENGGAERVAELLRQDSKLLNARDTRGRTPLDIALTRERGDLAAALRAQGGREAAELEDAAS